jgi:RNA polymerase sigma-70 factor (ECF subfamily)
MIDEKLLVWRFNRGDKNALRRIYEKYKDDLLGLAVSLLWDRSLAEDVVHDVFVSFAGTVGTFRLSGSLKGYLSTCVANGARDRNRLKSGRGLGLDGAETTAAYSNDPIAHVVGLEESDRLQDLLARLPYEQREVIVLHLHHGMRFRKMADALNVSINTVQSRYRYGLEKLRSMMNSGVMS